MLGAGCRNPVSIQKKRRKSSNAVCADCGHYRTQHTKGGEVCVAKELTIEGRREVWDYCACSRFRECSPYEKTGDTEHLVRCKTKIEQEKRRRSR